MLIHSVEHHHGVGTLIKVGMAPTCVTLKVARSPVFLRSTNLESKLIEFFVFVKFLAYPLFSLSVLLVLSVEQQWLHEPICTVEILHQAQIEQDVYTEYARTIYIYIYIYI